MTDQQFRVICWVILVAGFLAILFVLALMDLVIILKHDYIQLMEEVTDLRHKLKERSYI